MTWAPSWNGSHCKHNNNGNRKKYNQNTSDSNRQTQRTSKTIQKRKKEEGGYKEPEKNKDTRNNLDIKNVPFYLSPFSIITEGDH